MAEISRVEEKPEKAVHTTLCCSATVHARADGDTVRLDTLYIDDGATLLQLCK